MATISHKSQGAFKPSSWIKEGDGLTLSSSELRRAWISNKEDLLDFLKSPTSGQVDIFIRESALSRSSVLLLGYASEMFLKAGLVKLYGYCPEELVRAEVKNFGHRFLEIAERIHFPQQTTDKADFEILSKSVLEDARYPLTPDQNDDYKVKLNRIAAINSDQSVYERLQDLVRRMRSYVSAVDQDSQNPTSFTVRQTADGYFVARIGGNLPPMVTYRATQRLARRELLELILSLTRVIGPWDDYLIYRDSGERRRRKCERQDD